MKQWPTALLVPHTMDLLFTDLCRVVSIGSWESLGQALMSRYHSKNQAKILVGVQAQQDKISCCRLSHFYLKKLIPAFDAVTITRDASIRHTPHDFYISRYHLFNSDFDYLTYIVEPPVTSVDHTDIVVKAAQVFNQCEKPLQIVLKARLQHLFEQSREDWDMSISRQTLWKAALQGDCTFILSRLFPGIESDSRIPSSEQVSERFNCLIDREISPGLLLYLLRQNQLSRVLDWQKLIQQLLDADNFRTRETIQLMTDLICNSHIQKTDDLLLALKRYTDRLLKAAYHDLDTQIAVELRDLVTLRWEVLEALYQMPEHSTFSQAQKHSMVNEIFDLCKEHSNPSCLSHLAPMRVSNLLRSSLIELANDFFRCKKYPGLLASFQNKAAMSVTLHQLLSNLDKKWWSSTLFRRSGSVVQTWLQMAVSLIIEYSVERAEFVQSCLKALIEAHQWGLFRTLFDWKIITLGRDHFDQKLIESCIDNHGYFVGGVGDRSVLNWMNRGVGR